MGRPPHETGFTLFLPTAQHPSLTHHSLAQVLPILSELKRTGAELSFI
jgi:hypothetical protein